MKKIVALLTVLIMMLALAGCGGSGGSEEGSAAAAGGISEQTWKFSHEEYPGEYQDLYAHCLADHIAENSGGAITLQIYTTGQLGEGGDLLEVVSSGTADMGINSPGTCGAIIPEGNIFSFHYLMPADPADMDAFMSSDAECLKYIEDAFANQNIQVMDWGVEAGNVWTCNTPLREPADFKGVKFRTMAAPVISESYKMYGANTVQIAYSELFSSLQLGMADGQVNPAAGIYDMSFYEVQDYVTLSYPDYYVFEVGVNQDFWNSLSAEEQEILATSIEQTRADYIEARDNYIEENVSKLDGLIEIIELTDEQVDAFRTIAEEGRETLIPYLGDNGQEILDAFEADLAQYK